MAWSPNRARMTSYWRWGEPTPNCIVCSSIRSLSLLFITAYRRPKLLATCWRLTDNETLQEVRECIRMASFYGFRQRGSDLGSFWQRAMMAASKFLGLIQGASPFGCLSNHDTVPTRIQCSSDGYVE